MNYLIDKCILFLLCLSGIFLTGINSSVVAATLSAITITTMNGSFSGIIISSLLLFLYGCAALLVPEFVLFLPLILYDLPKEIFSIFYCKDPKKNRNDNRKTPLALCLLLILTGGFVLPLAGDLIHTAALQENSAFLIFQKLFLLFLCLTALLLRFRTERIQDLHQTLLRTRDDDTEIKLLLEERNHTLVEKQNGEIYTATLKERNRIAREIHDNVGHMLTRSILMVGALRTVSKDSALAAPLEQLNDTLNQAMNNIRESVHDLHDSSVNLKDSLQALVQEFHFCDAALDYDMSTELPKEVTYSFISIVKEALVNVSKHSNATKVQIIAMEHPGFYQLIIRDNGTDASAQSRVNPWTDRRKMDSSSRINSPEFSSGIGLKNMESRVRALGGTLQFSKDNGFRIYISIPKEA